MIYIIIFMSLLFFGIGFLITEKNAKNVLAGYNSMSEAERKKVDIQSFIPFFRKFHIYLGLSFLALGLLLHFLFGEMASGLFLGIYPILAYIYMMAVSRKFYSGQSAKSQNLGLIVLVFSLIVVLGLFVIGLRETKMMVSEQEIQITGIYGEKIPFADIDTVLLVDNLPEITWKIDGFAIGEVSKGRFKTAEGEGIKLMLNHENGPFVLIHKDDGKKLYYSGDQPSGLYEEILREMN